MADFTVSQIAVFDKEKELHYIEKNGEILFTAEEVGRHLGYGNPKESISTLFSRHKSELKLYSRNINLIFGNDSSAMRVFTEEGVYILSMLARTNEAKKFRARVALLLRRIRQETLRRQIEAARQTALAEGFALASSLSPLMLARLGKIRSYRERGFSQREISAVMGLHRRTVRQLEKLLPGFAAGGSVQEARHETR